MVTDAQLDPPGPRIVYVNRAFTRMTGYDTSEVVGRTPRLLQGPETDAATTARLRRSLEAGEPFDGETVNYRKDGSPFVMQLYVEPIRDAGDRITHFLAVQRDVTEQNETSKQRRAFEQVIGQLNDAVVLFSLDGRVSYVNAAYRRWWSLDDRQVLGIQVWKLPGAPTQASELRWARKSLSGGRAWQREYAVRQTGELGARRFLFVAVSPIRDEQGEVAEFLATVRDVTELRRLKAIAEAHNFHDHLGVIFSGIRHELGNPINSIKTALQVVTTSLHSMPEPKLRGYLEGMTEEIGRVEYLLRSLRSYSLYDTPRLETIDLREFLSHFYQLVRDDCEHRGIQLDLEIEADADLVWADPRALHQVLLNLVGNAESALEERDGARIEIRAGRRASYCTLIVRDNGPGVPAKHLPHVFKPFYTTRTEGTGLGLAISRHLLSLMRGSIELTSGPAGTEARIVLDRQQPAMHARGIG